MKSIAGVAAIMAFAVAPAFATAGKPHHVKPTHTVQMASLVCPVTGEKIKSVKDAAGFSVYKGKKYYFCCGGCKPMFDKNPAKYIKPSKK